MVQFSFDANHRLITTAPPSPWSVQVCPHLAPALGYLLASGSTVQSVMTDGWSRIDLDITLDFTPGSGPAPAAVPESMRRPPCESWINHDPHYPLAQGLLCRDCRQSIGWSCSPASA